MNVRTLSGDSIQAALADARRLLGDDVVLLESVPARDGQPARITVLTDAPAPPDGPLAPAVPTFADAARRAGLPGAGAPERPAPPAPARVAAPPTAPRRNLYPDAVPPASPPPPPASVPTAPDGAALDAALQKSLRPVLDRLAALERAFGGPLLASLTRWASHPLFRGLLDAGMRPETAADLFGALVGQGFDPAATAPDRQEALRWALAGVLRDRLGAAPVPRLAGSVLVVGAAGAGRTSLVLKLGRHASFFGRRRPGVLVVAPEDDVGLGHLDPLGPYARAGLPAALARSTDDVAAALAATPADPWLVDPPPLPRAPHAAAAHLDRLQGVLGPLVPLDVVLALDAGRAAEAAGLDRLRAHPLAPQAVALTRVDEMPGWGHLADLVLALPVPVHLVAAGRRVPDDLHAYSPGWLAEALARRLDTLGRGT